MTQSRPIAIPAPRAKRMGLASVTTGVILKPVRALLSGVEGVGKTTFAAGAPNPIFLGSEDGTGHLDVARFPDARAWPDVLEAIAEVTHEAHDYKTLVIDTLDWLEPLCWAHVCHQGGKANIEDFGFGRGYAAALEVWRAFASSLDRLRSERGMHVVLLAHAVVKKFSPPEGDPFDRYGLKMHERAAGYFREWSDAVLFARHEVFSVEKKGRMKGVSSGMRVMHTEWSAAWDAKNRFNLPPTLPLSWADFWSAVQAGAPAAASALEADVRALLPELPADVRTLAETELTKRAGDAAGLAKLLDRCRAKLGRKGDNE